MIDADGEMAGLGRSVVMVAVDHIRLRPGTWLIRVMDQEKRPVGVIDDRAFLDRLEDSAIADGGPPVGSVREDQMLAAGELADALPILADVTDMPDLVAVGDHLLPILGDSFVKRVANQTARLEAAAGLFAKMRVGNEPDRHVRLP